MRRTLPTVLAASAMLAWSACGDGTLKRIQIADSDEVVVEEGTILEDLLGDLGFSEFVSMDLTQAQELKNQGVEPGDITTAALLEFSLEATVPDGADLSFIDEMEIYVSAPELPRVLLASATDFPEGEALVQFEIEDVDLVDYVVSESLTLETEVSASRPSEDTTVEAAYVIEIGASLQGVRNAACGGKE